MATVISYVLISGAQDPSAVKQHSLVSDNELQFESENDEGDVPFLKFSLSSSLEEKPDLDPPCRALSGDFSGSVVTLCEVEERFNQVEHLRSVVYIDGEQAGEIEHGYILNVGT